MADFTKVHAFVDRELHRLLPNEPFTFALREPMIPGDVDQLSFIYIVSVKIVNNKLVPLTTTDRDFIEDWKKRHALTPEYLF